MSKHNQPKKCCNPREFVDLLDSLIIQRIKQHDDFDGREFEEEIELLKRDMTDYLLVNNTQKGVYVKGPND